MLHYAESRHYNDPDHLLSAFTDLTGDRRGARVNGTVRLLRCQHRSRTDNHLREGLCHPADGFLRRGGAEGEKAPMLRDAVLALTALGFNDETANKMVSKVLADNPSVKDVETLVRLALASR